VSTTFVTHPEQGTCVPHQPPPAIDAVGLTRRDALRLGLAVPVALAAGTLTAPGPDGSPTELDGDVTELERRYDAAVGLLAHNLRTGRRIAHRADERFAVLSVFKTVVAAAVLRDRARRPGDLDRRVFYPPHDILTYAPITSQFVDTGMTWAELCDAAIRYSDNTAGNLLLREVGGPQGLTAFARSIGDRVFRLDRWEEELNSAIPGDPRDTTTPRAIARTYARLVTGDALDGGDRRRLTDWLLRNTTSDERFRAGLPDSWDLADKTGTGAYGSANDVGVAFDPDGTPIVIAALTRRSEQDATVDPALLADLARLVVRRIG